MLKKAYLYHQDLNSEENAKIRDENLLNIVPVNNE